MELRGSRGLCQERVTYSPFVEFVACGTMDSHILLPDAQKRANLGLYAAVDLPPGRPVAGHTKMRCSIAFLHRSTHIPHHRVVTMTTMQSRAMQNRL